MLANIVKEIGIVELDDSELQQPISVTDHGSVATVRDVIAEKAPADVRAMFASDDQITPGHVAPGEHVQSVGELDIGDLRRVTKELLRRLNPDIHIAAIGLGDFSTNELMTEVDRGTAMGNRIIDAVRLNGVFVETAIACGKIRPKHDIYHDLAIPGFDF